MRDLHILLAGADAARRDALRRCMERRRDVRAVALAPAERERWRRGFARVTGLPSAERPFELLHTVARLAPHAVVVDLPEDGADPPLCARLLAEFPELIVAALRADSPSGIVYATRIERHPLRAARDEDVLDAIRSLHESRR